ncbi:MAG TPA: pyridoxamine 5'-phosphate oxidase family protein [Streptosporangiaceae bacterium]|nr:pyridoxamine 5'-phosphate oxidase family protein [Streptosporangiaceae bacterium]
MTGNDAAQTAADLIEASRYLVLATADETGRPWSSPVYFAHLGFTEFFWVSSPDVTHSRNIAVRPEVGIVVFDSQAAIGTGQGAYMSAVAALVEGDAETTRGSRRSPAVRSPTAAMSGRARTSVPAPGCGSTGRPPTLTGSWPRTANPITAFPCRCPDTNESRPCLQTNPILHLTRAVPGSSWR